MIKQNSFFSSAVVLAVSSLLLTAGCGAPSTPPPAAGAVDTAQADAAREAELAAKQQELAQREAELALKERELEVARREEQLAAQQRQQKKPAPSRPRDNRPEPGAPISRPPEATTRNEPPRPASASIVVPAGTQLTVALASDLTTKTARPGDTFEARLVSDLTVNGRQAASAGSRVMGTVTAVISGSSKIGGVPTLGLSFDSLELGNGSKVAISGELVEQGRSDTGRDSAKILGGAAAGAVLGHQVKKNDGGKVIGGLLGGVIGAIAAQKTGTEVLLPAGSTLTILLGAPFQVSGS